MKTVKLPLFVYEMLKLVYKKVYARVNNGATIEDEMIEYLDIATAIVELLLRYDYEGEQTAPTADNHDKKEEPNG